MILFDGVDKAVFDQSIRPERPDIFAVSWQNRVNGSAVGSTSWTVPTGWAVSLEESNVSVTVDGVVYTNSNKALIEAPPGTAPGRYQIINRQAFSDSRDLDAVFFVRVEV